MKDPSFIGSITLGGDKSQGCCTVGNERDVDLRVLVDVKGIHASYEWANLSPTPRSFLWYVKKRSDGREPFVILPNGRVLVPSDNSQYARQFTESIAEVIAAQNKGIYFPASFRAGETRMPFEQLLSAMERSVHNMNPSRESVPAEIAERAKTPELTEILRKELQYIPEVRIATGEENTVVGSMQNSEHPQGRFGQEGQNYFVELSLTLEGFGWNHYGVSSKKLTATFEGVHLKKGEPEIALLNRHFQHMVGPNEEYRFEIESLDHEKKEIPFYHAEGGSIYALRLDMRSPAYTLSDQNNKLEKKVMETAEMLKLFKGVSDKVSAAICGARAHRARQYKQELAVLASEMGLPTS